VTSRLNKQIRDIIFRVLKENFGKEAKLILFGSQVDLNRKGGDIDILIESDFKAEEAYNKKIKSLTEIHLALENEEKIDLIITASGKDDDRPVVKEAILKGIPL
jgi:predicted nucleotidyltransferase